MDKAYDNYRYSKRRDGGVSFNDFPSVTPPAGWEWQGPWKLDCSSNTDKHGWSYGVDFSMLSYPFTSGSGTRALTHFVRRRRWVRQRRRVVSSQSPQPPQRISSRRGQAAGANSTNGGEAVSSDDSNVLLGVVLPGCGLAVPLYLLEVSGDLRVRPMLPASEESETLLAHHNWSVGASEGAHNVVLNMESLDATSARLLQCTASHQAPTLSTTGEVPTLTDNVQASKSVRSFSAESLRSVVCFISLRVDAQNLPNAGPYGLDWRISLHPPLAVQNLLPVPADYNIYEVPTGAFSAVKRQSGMVEAGGTIAVYSADVRRQTGLMFVPRGYQWHTKYPLVLSFGYSSHSAGVGTPKMMPSTFALSNANTKVPLLVHVERELVNGPTSSEQPGRSDPGAELAVGNRMLVRVHVPLWVLNLTQTLVSVAISERAKSGPPVAAARRLAYGSTERADASVHGAAASHMAKALTLDTIDCSSQTKGATAPSQPQSHCQVLPGSCELLSYTASTNIGQDMGPARETVLQVGILGAPWSPGLVFAASTDERSVPRKGDAVANASSSLQESRPVLLRAHVPQNGAVLEVVAHLQVCSPCVFSLMNPCVIARGSCYCVVGTRPADTICTPLWEPACFGGFHACHLNKVLTWLP
jgi:hypothetical protein